MNIEWKFCIVQITIQVLYASTFGYLWSNCTNISAQNILLSVESKNNVIGKVVQVKHLWSIPHHKYRHIGHWILCICTSDPCCNNEQDRNIKNYVVNII